MKLSHSKLETWESCEYQFALQNVYRMPQGPSDAAILGRAFHKAIERDGLEKLADPSSSLSYTDLCNIAADELAIHLAHDDPDGELDTANIRQRLRSMLRAYVEEVQHRYKPIIAPELKFPRMMIGDNSFDGTIDAATAVAILDWKSAMSWRKWDQSYVDTNAQATAYWMAIQHIIAHKDTALALREALSTIRKITFMVFMCDPIMPDECTVVAFQTTRDESDVATYRKRITNTASEIRIASMRGTFSAKPSSNCSYCGVLGSCAIGRAYIEATKRKVYAPMRYPMADAIARVKSAVVLDESYPDVCDACHIKGRVVQSHAIYARPASASYHVYSLCCEECGSIWAVKQTLSEIVLIPTYDEFKTLIFDIEGEPTHESK